MKVQYYEAILRSDSNDFQEWDPQFIGSCEEAMKRVEVTLRELEQNITCHVEPGFMCWADSEYGLCCAIVTDPNSSINDYRHAWGPIAYPNSN